MAKFNLFAAIDIGSSRLELKIFQLTKEGGVSVIENCESKLSIGKESYHSGKISYELASEDQLVMAAGTYTHPDKGSPFDEYNKEGGSLKKAPGKKKRFGRGGDRL